MLRHANDSVAPPRNSALLASFGAKANLAMGEFTMKVLFPLQEQGFSFPNWALLQMRERLLFLPQHYSS